MRRRQAVEEAGKDLPDNKRENESETDAPSNNGQALSQHHLYDTRAGSSEGQTRRKLSTPERNRVRRHAIQAH